MSEVIAAVLGALVVWGTTYFMERSKKSWAKEENAAHLGAVVLVLLERFIADCAKVAGDDGTAQGRPAGRHESGEEYYVPQTSLPKLDLQDLKVEWRAISPSLMYAIHAVSLDLNEVVEHLEHVADNDFLPYDEYMGSRQRQLAELGVKVTGIARRLRVESGISARPAREWDAEIYLRERLALFLELEGKKRANAPMNL